MAYTKGRKIDNSGRGGQFLKEEPERGKLGNGSEVMPKTHFVQVDNGVQTGAPGGLHPGTDITKVRMKSGNVEKDLSGGLY